MILGLWTLRRFGWVLAIQPLIFGLILLSRREWAIGGASLGIAGITVILSELLPVGRYPDPSKRRLPKSLQETIKQVDRQMSESSGTRTVSMTDTHHRISDSSMLQRIAALLPAYTRLPPSCPLPIDTEIIDDLSHTERAAYANPALPQNGKHERDEGLRLFYDPTGDMRGRIYPPEMLVPSPVIWLPDDGDGNAEREMGDLISVHGLNAIMDPVLYNDGKGKGKGKERTIA